MLLMRFYLLVLITSLPVLLFAQYQVELALNVPIGQGTVLIAVYGTEEDFDKNEDAVLYQKVPVTKVGDYKVILEGLAPGKYAIALFQDVNDNKKLDTNMLGIPQEPYAFSRNPPVKWRAPRYSEAVFELKESMKMSMALKKWRKQ